MVTSYTRRRGDYVYDIEVNEATIGQFYGRVVNMVLRTSGQTTSVNPGLADAYGETIHEAVSKIDAAVEAWVKDRPTP